MQYKITFQQIEYFLTVADTLNFTEAAKILFISQPALSKQISVIEQELGFPLFIRDRRHVVLTPEGAYLNREWRNVNSAMEASIYQANRLRNRASGSLSIGCSDTFDYTDVLPRLIRKYSEVYPQVDLDIASHSFKTLRDSFQKDKLDIILTPYFEVDGLSEICWMKLKDIPLSIIIPTSNPLSLKDKVSMQDLKEESFILISPKDSPGGIERTQSLCRRCGFQTKNARYVPNVSSLTLAVQNGLGVAICNSNSFQKETDYCRIYPLDVQQDDSFLVAVWKKNRQNVALDLLINMIQVQFPNPVHG